MILDYQCVTEGAVASSRLMKARQYVTAETFMMGFVLARVLISASVSGVKSVVGTAPHWLLQ